MITHSRPRLPLRSHTSSDGGFSLIELVVVVVILGILAAIAVPVFLNQQSKAQDSAATSDLINLRTAVVSYSVANDGAYPAPTVDLAEYGAVTSTRDEPTVVVSDADFCIEVVSDSSTALFVTRDGGVQEGTCTVLGGPTPEPTPELSPEPSPVVAPTPSPTPTIDTPLGRRR